MKGNLTERVVAVVLSLVITVPAVFGNIYLLIWQTYVLRVEVILNAIQLSFMGLELLFGIISCITFARFVQDAETSLFFNKLDYLATFIARSVQEAETSLFFNKFDFSLTLIDLGT